MAERDPQFIRPVEAGERNWLPLAIAAGVVIFAVVLLVVLLEHGKQTTQVTPVSAALDPYAASLPITEVKMSESSNLAGGKVTYIDGHIANRGARTVHGISMQVLFRNAAHEAAQNETHSLQLIRTRQPYVDLEPLGADPLKPGDERDFRLIFDAVSPDWDGAYPELRIVHVESN